MTTRVVLLFLFICTLPLRAAELFPTNSTWRFFRGTNEASLPDTTAWRAPAFVDANFATAPAPFWYSDVRPGGTQLGDMLNRYSCFFLRKTFTVTGPDQIGGLRLRYYIDDGFVAWINGVEIYRENVVGDILSTNTLASNQPIDPATFATAVVAPVGVLQEGPNVIAVQVFNTSLGSSDIGFDLALESIPADNTPPTIVSVSPAPGSLASLTQVTVTFSEPVGGVDAGDLLVSGLPADAVAVESGGTNFIFSFGPPPFGLVTIAWATDHGISDLAPPPDAFNATAPGRAGNTLWSIRSRRP